MEKKNKFIAGALAITLVFFGAHKFYLGKKKAGIALLVCSLITIATLRFWIFLKISMFELFLFYIALSIRNSLVGVSVLEGVAYLFLSDKALERHCTKINWWLAYLILLQLFVTFYLLPFFGNINNFPSIARVYRLPLFIIILFSMLIFFLCAMLIAKRTAPNKNKYLAGTPLI